MSWVSNVIKLGFSLNISIFLIALILITPVHAEAAEADPSWHTFHGTSFEEAANAVAVDDEGNAFIAEMGASYATGIFSV